MGASYQKPYWPRNILSHSHTALKTIHELRAECCRGSSFVADYKRRGLQCGTHANTEPPRLCARQISYPLLTRYAPLRSLHKIAGNRRTHAFVTPPLTPREEHFTTRLLQTCSYQASAPPLLSGENFGVGRAAEEAEEVEVEAVVRVEEAAGAAVVAAQGLSARGARAKVFLLVAKGPVLCPLFLLGNHLLAGVKAVERGETSTETGKFCAGIIDCSKILTSYRRAYGSGYPGIAGKGTVGRGFPFFFWPLAFGTVGLGGAYHYHSDVGALYIRRDG